jgi:hypothetical protein
MNMNLLRALSRLPLALWLRGLGVAIVVIAMLAFGLAIVATAVVAVSVGVLVYKMRDWLSGLFASRHAVPVHIKRGRVSDADYTIIDRR